MNISVWDLDGTLADIVHRRHFVEKISREGEKQKPNWQRFFAACVSDKPIQPVIDLFNAVRGYGNRVEIWSGRSDEVREETVAWLDKYVFTTSMHEDIYWNDPNSVHYVRLRMRPEKDTRPDDVLKEEWLDDALLTQRISFSVDDRDRIVAMWRRRGIVCLQAAPGDF